MSDGGSVGAIALIVAVWLVFFSAGNKKKKK